MLELHNIRDIRENTFNLSATLALWLNLFRSYAQRKEIQGLMGGSFYSSRVLDGPQREVGRL